MADFDFPPDLIELQRAWYAADARCVEISVSLPSAAEVVAGVVRTVEQDTELAEARAERLRLTEALHDHGWWDSAKDRLAAKAALRKAAQQ